MAIPLGQRPLTASAADAALFTGREQERSQIRRALRLGFNVLLLSERGSGLTSLLRQAERDLARGEVAYVDGQPWSDVRDLFHAVQAALGLDLRRQPLDPRPNPDRFLTPGFRSEAARSREREWVDVGQESTPFNEIDVQQFVRAVDERRVVLLDRPSLDCVSTLFGRFRDALWEAPLQWVVAGDVNRRHAYLKPPADAFFEVVVELDPLTDEEARQLLSRRIEAAGDDEDAARLAAVVDELVDGLGDRTPRGVLSAARDVLMAEGDPRDAWRRRASAQARAAALGRAPAMVYLELESLGPTHAGDKRLLERLGYTRPRAVQVIKQLEEAGLLTSRREGKRVLYAVADGG